jgi:hypothetical protein
MRRSLSCVHAAFYTPYFGSIEVYEHPSNYFSARFLRISVSHGFLIISVLKISRSPLIFPARYFQFEFQVLPQCYATVMIIDRFIIGVVLVAILIRNQRHLNLRIPESARVVEAVFVCFRVIPPSIISSLPHHHHNTHHAATPHHRSSLQLRSLRKVFSSRIIRLPLVVALT